MDKKKTIILLSVLLSVFLITNVFAIWIVSISSNATYKIESGVYGGLSVTKELVGESFDSLSGEIRSSDDFIFNNEGVATNLNITIRTTVIGTNESCPNWENDCSINYYLNETYPLNSGSYIKMISPGENKISVDINCVQYSCPQDITTKIDIWKVPN